MASRPTLHHDSSSEPECYVCRRMNNRKPTIQLGGSATCLLCNKNFCERHKGKEEGVCETNHVSYYRNHPLRWGTIFSSLEARKNEVEKSGSLVGKKQNERKNEEQDGRGSEAPEETGPSTSKP